MSAISSRRMVPEKEVTVQPRVFPPHHFPPTRRYGDRTSKVRVRFNTRTGLGEVVDVEEGDQMLTEGGGGRNLRVRNITAREGIEDEKSDGDTEIEDLDDQLIRLIESTPRPHTTSHVLRLAVNTDCQPEDVGGVLCTLPVPARKDFDYHDDYEEDCSEHFHQERPKCTCCSQLVNISSSAFRHYCRGTVY